MKKPVARNRITLQLNQREMVKLRRRAKHWNLTPAQFLRWAVQKMR